MSLTTSTTLHITSPMGCSRILYHSTQLVVKCKCVHSPHCPSIRLQHHLLNLLPPPMRPLDPAGHSVSPPSTTKETRLSHNSPSHHETLHPRGYILALKGISYINGKLLTFLPRLPVSHVLFLFLLNQQDCQLFLDAVSETSSCK